MYSSLLQWGTNKCGSNNYILFSLPINFTKLGIIVASDVFNRESSSSITQSIIGISLNGLSHAEARGRGITSGGDTLPNSSPTFNWVAIGF